MEAGAAAPVGGEDAHPELGNAVDDGEVCCPAKRRLIGDETEHRVAAEIDARGVVAQGGVRHCPTEAKPPVLAGKREQMCSKGAAIDGA
jgi:hypothetical protein